MPFCLQILILEDAIILARVINSETPTLWSVWAPPPALQGYSQIHTINFVLVSATITPSHIMDTAMQFVLLMGTMLIRTLKVVSYPQLALLDSSQIQPKELVFNIVISLPTDMQILQAGPVLLPVPLLFLQTISLVLVLLSVPPFLNTTA